LVVNQKLNVDRRFVRQIRGMLHAWAVYGPEKAQEVFARRYDNKDRYPGATPSFEATLRGRIAYLSQIRGETDPIVRLFSDQFTNLKAFRDINEGIVRSAVPRPLPDPIRQESMVATIMFEDIVGSTERARELGDKAWRGVMNLHDKAVIHALSDHGGRLVKRLGDGVLAVFASPSRAIESGLMLCETVKNDAGVEVRVGLHTGEVMVSRDDVAGLAVNAASRIVDVAGESEVLVSQALADLILGSSIVLEDRGIKELKGIGSWRLFAASSP
jgi:class 3 adenylate cyclase